MRKVNKIVNIFMESVLYREIWKDHEMLSSKDIENSNLWQTVNKLLKIYGF